MNIRAIRCGAIAMALAISCTCQQLTAQVAVLSGSDVKASQQQLSSVAQRTASPEVRAYLAKLNNAGDAAATVNAVRISDDFRAAGAEAIANLSHYTVPAMSNVMRLADAYPADGQFNAPLGIVLAQDEYEPASFVLHSFADLDKVELKLSAFKSTDGGALAKESLDLKVVKVWFQGGNGWFSYFSDAGLEVVPELLLNDEKLIDVDVEKQGNFARIGEDGKRVWISSPNKVDAGFDPYQPGFADAATLQPVSLEAGKFKQFVLTAHATAETKPGLYRGTIEVAAANQPAYAIPVSVRVLPFLLPAPKAAGDLEKDFIVTLMTAWPKLDPDHPAFLLTLQNLRRHNLIHLGPGVSLDTPPEQADKLVALMKQAGFSDHPIINGSLRWAGTHDGTPYTFDELMGFKRNAVAWREFYMKHFGHSDAAISLGDEPPPSWVMKARQAWRIVHENGLKTSLAGHGQIYQKAGYTMDIHPTAGTPADAKNVQKWNDLGHAHVSFYASQHNGSENPDFVRRQHGLLGYLSGFDMVNNYEFAYGPWNDRATELYKPMVLAYPTSNGLVDTLAWEGFREGIDDIRYATKLRQLAHQAIDTGKLDNVYAGRQVLQWFSLMDGKVVDLNAVRLEMVEKILHLSQLLK